MLQSHFRGFKIGTNFMYKLLNVTFYTLGAILRNIIDIVLASVSKTKELTVKKEHFYISSVI